MPSKGSVMDTITLTINGQELNVERGTTVMEAARNADIYIPGLCNYPDLKPLPEVTPDMACQLCLVEINSIILLSCTTKAVEGMKVETETPRIKELRRRSLTNILYRYPGVENRICELQQPLNHIGVGELPPHIPKRLPIREDSPFFVRDHNLCILCERCVRVCDDLRDKSAMRLYKAQRLGNAWNNLYRRDGHKTGGEQLGSQNYCKGSGQA